jgi:outer membrane receptor for ferric coprogen and ferric-rhodotorulic acid
VRFPGENEQNSVDLKFSGPFTVAEHEHEAVVGLSHLDQEYAYDRIGANTPWSSPFDVDDFGSLPEPAWSSTVVSSENNHTRQSAAYGAVRLSLADPLKLILGGRFTRYSREGAGYNGANAYEYDDQHFVPYAGLVYDLSDHFSAYASYTNIFKYQDYQDRNGGWLEPVTGDAYETGLKGEFFERRLNASIALFRIEQDKLAQQDTGYLVPGTTRPAYYASEGATSKGVELELSGELAPGWNAFFFATRYSAKDAEDDDINSSLPRNMVRLYTTYQLSGQWQNLTVGGGANWQSDIYYEM